MKKTIIALSIIPVIAFSMTTEQKEAFNKANVEVLKKKGLPIPDSGVQVIPQEQMKMEGWQKQKLLSESKELKNKGYINRSSPNAHNLLNIENKIKKMRPLEKSKYKSTSSHLREKSEDISFAYTYVGVPKNDIIEYYGIAPAGTYIKEPQSGWTGAIEFFKTSFAICSYTEKNMLAAHGSAQIAEEEAQYDINGKITLIDVEGNESTGYLYRVNWFDNIFNRNLQCATKDFSESVREAAINLAIKIDKA